jgi:hypothetical protein
MAWRRAVFGLACLGTLVALAYAEENWRGRHAWQAYRQEWEAKGEKFTLAPLLPPAVPDEKNLALAPLLRPALELSNGPGGVVWRDTNGWARLQAFNAGLPANRPTNNVIELGSIEKGTFASLSAWREFYRGNTNYPAAAPEATPAETVLTALGKFDTEFQELRVAAAQRPDARFPVQYEEQPPWGVMLPHLAQVKSKATAFQVRATAELEAGRPAEAFADLKLGLRLSESIKEEPIVISHLVRLVTLAGAVQTMREGLIRHAWTDGQLADFQASLAPINLLAEYKVAMRGERAGSVAELDYLRRHGSWGIDVSSFFGPSVTTCERVLQWAPGGWSYQNMQALSEFCQDCTLPSVDEKARRIFPDISEKGTRELEARRGPFTLFVKLAQPALHKVLQRAGRMQTFADATRIACAIERYRLANGKLPESLTELTPRFCEGIPHDVIDDQPLRWRHLAEGGYVIYSVGWNKTDDGGELGWNQNDDSGVLGMLKEKRGAWVDPAKGDWAWTLPATPKSGS